MSKPLEIKNHNSFSILKDLNISVVGGNLGVCERGIAHISKNNYIVHYDEFKKKFIIYRDNTKIKEFLNKQNVPGILIN